MVKTNNIMDIDKMYNNVQATFEEGRCLEKLNQDNESFFIYQKVTLFVY